MLSPTRRDGDVARDLLARIDVSLEVCTSAAHLADSINAAVGAILMTDSSLVDREIGKVLSELTAQPPWSDIPVILMCRAVSTVPDQVIRSFTNLTLLERPTSARTLVSAVQAAIRARLRQYQIRDQLAALRDADEALRRADQRKDEFLAMLAHELRNPLAPIRNASAILARLLPEEPRLQSTTGIIERQITHLTRLVDDLLDVSRITQGRIALKRTTLELAPVVAEALERSWSCYGATRGRPSSRSATAASASLRRCFRRSSSSLCRASARWIVPREASESDSRWCAGWWRCMAEKSVREARGRARARPSRSACR
jgi:signal transduction histidine kinase